MAGKQKKLYELSEAAAEDISDIYDYTIFEFGENQVVSYLTGLEQKFLSLADQSLSGRNRDEIKKDLKSVNFKKYVIFYRIIRGKLRIVRVLHERCDIPRQFENE